MIRDKTFPGVWVKYGDAWTSAVGYWRAISDNLIKFFVTAAAALVIFIKFEITWFTLALLAVIFYISITFLIRAMRQWGLFRHVEYDTSIVMKPKWKELGGEDEWKRREIFD